MSIILLVKNAAQGVMALIKVRKGKALGAFRWSLKNMWTSDTLSFVLCVSVALWIRVMDSYSRPSVPSKQFPDLMRLRVRNNISRDRDRVSNTTIVLA